MAKPPTPQGISALLRKAGFARSVRHAGRRDATAYDSEGYRAQVWNPGEVRVRHMTVRAGVPSERKQEMFARYAKAIRSAGWTVAEPADFAELIVKAGDTQSAGEGET